MERQVIVGDNPCERCYTLRIRVYDSSENEENRLDRVQENERLVHWLAGVAV